MKSAAPTNFTADRQHSAQVRLTPGSDRCVTPRFRVDFRTIMSANSPMIEQMGSVLDLSLAGGRVETSLTVQTSLVRELRIYVPDLDWPIMVDEAVVQWVKGEYFRSAFCATAPKPSGSLGVGHGQSRRGGEALVRSSPVKY